MSENPNSQKSYIRTLHVALIGHVDHGKSTLAGRTLYELGLVNEKVIQEYKEQSILSGKPTCEYAWVMDIVKEERLHGVTIVPSYRLLEVDTKRIVLVDGPGHPDYTKNTILAIGVSDSAVLVVAADDGIMDQTKEHAVLAYAFGIRDLIVVINKMDRTHPLFDRQRYEDIKLNILILLNEIGFDENSVVVLPAAAYFGDNLTRQSENLKWYSGPTFYQAIAQLRFPENLSRLPFRLAVDNAFPKRGIGQIATGRVASGSISRGAFCIIMPGNHRAKIKSIESFKKAVDSISAGDDVGIALSGVSPEVINRGSVLGTPNNPPTVAKTILARITVLDDKPGLHIGRSPLFFAHSTRTLAKIIGLVSRVSSSTDKVIERKPINLLVNETGYVEIELQSSLVLEPLKENSLFSRFILREQDRTVAIGSCVEVLE